MRRDVRFLLSVAPGLDLQVPSGPAAGPITPTRAFARALERFCALPESSLERSERLEQLREKYERDGVVGLHVTGFAKIVGDVSAATLEVVGFFNVGGGTGEHGQFQIQVDVAGAAFTLDRVFVEVFEISAADGSEINKVIVPVVLGTRIVPGYIGYREHLVRSGDTLWAIAEANYGNGSQYPLIVRANPTVITDPDLIFPGQVLKVPIGA